MTVLLGDEAPLRMGGDPEVLLRRTAVRLRELYYNRGDLSSAVRARLLRSIIADISEPGEEI